MRNTEEDLMERYNIKNVPTVIVVKATEKRPQIYKGEMKFNELFKFINIFSEVFVPGGGSSSVFFYIKFIILKNMFLINLLNIYVGQCSY